MLGMEYRNNASILSVGYKNPTLNFVLPVLFVDSLVPTIISAALYVLGYIYRKKLHPLVQIKRKEEDVRRDELKLISDKGNAIYEKERLSG